jgi:uncharacterized OsmC-like protein
MGKTATSIVKQRQDPLRARYRSVPSEALITHHARTIDGRGADPFHGAVILGEGFGAQWRFGVHRAVGGDHDLPTPEDMLCAALASCLDATVRMIADRLDIPIQALEVAVSAEADVRGELIVDPSVPVGFHRICCCLGLRPAADVHPERLQLLLAATEHSCAVLQTLRKGVPVETRVVEPVREAAQ